MRTVESWLEIAENAIKAAINANSLNNIKQNEMKRDEIVEKIKKIKGVGTVAYNEEQAVVRFKPEDKYVHVTTLEQLDFIWIKQHGKKHGNLHTNMCVLIGQGSGWDKKSESMNLVSFSDYLKEYNLQEEWKKYLIGEAEKRGFFKHKHKWDKLDVERPVCTKLKYNPNWIADEGCLYDLATSNVIWRSNKGWAAIVKEVELVEGEIYFVEYKDSDNRVVRYLGMDGTRCVFFYSQYSKQLGLLLGTFADSDYSGSLALHGNELKPATKKQKKKLIKAEVKNGFFYELEKK